MYVMLCIIFFETNIESMCSANCIQAALSIRTIALPNKGHNLQGVGASGGNGVRKWIRVPHIALFAIAKLAERPIYGWQLARHGPIVSGQLFALCVAFIWRHCRLSLLIISNPN
jgi:hypothetical protein